MPFRFHRLEIPDVVLIEPTVVADDRGAFIESYRNSEFVAAGIRDTFLQDNQSRSGRGVLRGLHYQKRAAAQAKLVQVITGGVFDVAVDLRRSSPTYGKWVGVSLSAENNRMVYIPVGFAHGFCVLSDLAVIVYKASHEYAPEDERGIAWNDRDLQIVWPVAHPLLSARDSGLPPLRLADIDFD